MTVRIKLARLLGVQIRLRRQRLVVRLIKQARRSGEPIDNNLYDENDDADEDAGDGFYSRLPIEVHG